MKKNILYLFLCGAGLILFGVTVNYLTDKKQEVIGQKTVIEFTGLQWNRYETKSFEILSINDDQGKFVFNNIEYLKLWVLNRWGIKDVDFKSKCKVILVADADLYFQIFGKRVSSFRYDLNSAMWIITLTRWDTHILSQFVTEMCLLEMQSKFNVKFGFWAHRGMSVLNGNLVEIKVLFDNNVNLISSKSFLNLTEEDYIKMTELEKNKFNLTCAGFCLMIIKQNGTKSFLGFLDSSKFNVEKSLILLQVNDYNHLDLMIITYFKNLKNKEISYFTW